MWSSQCVCVCLNILSFCMKMNDLWIICTKCTGNKWAYNWRWWDIISLHINDSRSPYFVWWWRTVYMYIYINIYYIWIFLRFFCFSLLFVYMMIANVLDVYFPDVPFAKRVIVMEKWCVNFRTLTVHMSSIESVLTNGYLYIYMLIVFRYIMCVLCMYIYVKCVISYNQHEIQNVHFAEDLLVIYCDLMWSDMIQIFAWRMYFCAL